MVAARVESGRPDSSLDHCGFNALLGPRLCLATPGIDRSGSIAGNGDRTRIFISALRQRSDTAVNKRQETCLYVAGRYDIFMTED
jgi:hypothetical protein